MARPLLLTASCLALLLGSACLNDNLNFDPSTGGATDSLTEGSSTSATSSATTATTAASSATTAAGATSGESDGSTSAASTDLNTDTDTDTDTDTGDEGPPTCPRGSQESLTASIVAMGDRVVISENMTVKPCAWGMGTPDCRDLGLNSGFVQMTNSEDYGTTFFLLKFSRHQVLDLLKLMEQQPIGYRIRITYYEPQNAPEEAKTLGVAPLLADDDAWSPATATFNHRSEGVAWSGQAGGLRASLGDKVAQVIVDAEATAAEMDDGDPNAYHAYIHSSPIQPEVIGELLAAEVDPSFAIYVTAPKGFGLDTNGNFGVKLLNGGWGLPALVPIFCE